METYEGISPDEAAEALAAAERSRARVAWSGYPWWYWLTTGAGMGLATYAVGQQGWWGPAIAAVIAVSLVYVAYAAARARGVCVGWVRGAMTTSTGSPRRPPAASYSFLPCGISRPAIMNRAGCMPQTTATGQGRRRKSGVGQDGAGDQKRPGIKV